MSDFYLHFTLGLPHLYTMLTLYDCTYVLSQHFFLSSSDTRTDHLTWISYSHAVRRNIFHDYASCADHYVASYRYSGHHLYTCAKPYVISYFNWICIFQTPIPPLEINRMSRCMESAIRSNEHIIPESNSACIKHNQS